MAGENLDQGLLARRGWRRCRICQNQHTLRSNQQREIRHRDAIATLRELHWNVTQAPAGLGAAALLDLVRRQLVAWKAREEAAAAAVNEGA